MILPEWLLHFCIDIGDLGAWSKMIQLRVHKVQVKGTESQKLRVSKIQVKGTESQKLRA